MTKTKLIKKIICVDDDQDIREVAKMVLETVGEFDVTTFDNGKDLISQAEKINADAILLDVMMPQMDGPTTLKILRQNKSLDATPIILMTARIQPKEVEEYLQLGASGVISKPFDPMTLPSEINKIAQEFYSKQN